MISNINETNINKDKFFLGNLCLKNHNYNNTEKSLRFKQRSQCVECKKIYTLKYDHEKSQKTKEKQIKKQKEIDNLNKKFNIDTKFLSLGELCCRKHSFKNTGYSLRDKKTHKCLECRKFHSKNDKIINPTNKLNHHFSLRIYKTLKGNKNYITWEKLVDYNFLNLTDKLNSLFSSSMTFKNYSSFWEVDHIIPISYFNFSSYENEEFKLCWNLKNLKPEFKTQNRKKHNKFAGSFNNIILTKKEFLELKNLFPIKLLCNCVWNEYWKVNSYLV